MVLLSYFQNSMFYYYEFFTQNMNKDSQKQSRATKLWLI